MTSTRGLLRVELDNRESIENPVRLTYWWKCCKCGEEFWTRSLKKDSSFCPFCQKAKKEQAQIARQKKMKREQLAVLRKLWKEATTISKDDSLSFNGKLYVSKSALNTQFNNLIEQLGE